MLCTFAALIAPPNDSTATLEISFGSYLTCTDAPGTSIPTWKRFTNAVAVAWNGARFGGVTCNVRRACILLFIDTPVSCTSRITAEAETPVLTRLLLCDIPLNMRYRKKPVTPRTANVIKQVHAIETNVIKPEPAKIVVNQSI